MWRPCLPHTLSRNTGLLASNKTKGEVLLCWVKVFQACFWAPRTGRFLAAKQLQSLPGPARHICSQLGVGAHPGSAVEQHAPKPPHVCTQARMTPHTPAQTQPPMCLQVPVHTQIHICSHH